MSIVEPTAELPPEHKMDRDDALDAFVAVVNACEPEHPTKDYSIYPITRDEVDYGVTRTLHASCGPRKSESVHCGYNTRMSYINEINRARHLALLVHEISHITHGCEWGKSGHPPAFWREMAFHALNVRDSLESGGLIAEKFGRVDIDEFLAEVVADPNSATVDRRYWTVEECRNRVADLVGVKRPYVAVGQ